MFFYINKYIIPILKLKQGIKMKKLFILSAIAAGLFAAEYQAGAGIGRNGVTNSPIKNYDFGNIRVGKYLPKNHILRLEVEKSTGIKTDTQKTSLSRMLLNVEKDFNIDSSLIPYAFAGVGYQWIKGAYNNAAVADLGIGAKYNLSKTFALFAEARGLRDFHNNDNHYGFIGGFIFNFGGEKAAAKSEPVKVIDGDNEGVVDSMDKCPNTPAGVKVNKNGCAVDSDNDGVPDYLDKCPNTPAGVKVDKNGCAIDSDNDGVAYYLDKCPNTPAGVKVDSNGCAVDSDNDGVADYLDKCPNTPAGMKVDKNGCAVNFNFDITFDNDSAKIKSEFMTKIKKFADFLKSHSDIKAEIQGYTDNRGKYRYNMVLSEKRAKAVYEALIKLGVNKEQISWAGYGPENPVASNDTKEGRAENRRVVAKIIY